MNDNSIEARVARGVELLDQELRGWADRIDLDRLDLGSTCDCVLGQEFMGCSDEDPYDVGVYELFEGQEDQAEEHGFTLLSFNRDFALLTAEWRRVILARRAVTA